jgi:hypothetical protein
MSSKKEKSPLLTLTLTLGVDLHGPRTYADGAALGVAVTAVTLTVPVSELRRRPVRRRVGPAVGLLRLRRRATLRRGPRGLCRGPPSPRSYAEGPRRRIVRRGQVGDTPRAVGRRHLAGFL